MSLPNKNKRYDNAFVTEICEEVHWQSLLDKSTVQKCHDLFLTESLTEVINEASSHPFGSRKIKLASVNDNCEPVLIFSSRYKYRPFIRHFVETNFRDLSDSDVWLINQVKDSIKIRRRVSRDKITRATWTDRRQAIN